MSKFQKIDYFIPVSTTHSCNSIVCSGHSEEINRIVSYHTMFEIICCLIFERQSLCERCENCFLCARLRYFIEQFSYLDQVNSADNDIYWSKVDFYKDLSSKTFGHLVGFKKISLKRDFAKKRKLV